MAAPAELTGAFRAALFEIVMSRELGGAARAAPPGPAPLAGAGGAICPPPPALTAYGAAAEAGVPDFRPAPDRYKQSLPPAGYSRRERPEDVEQRRFAKQTAILQGVYAGEVDDLS